MKLELQISINRNIVECKDFRNISVCQLIFVLIETLWNVKMDINEANFIPTAVLIETLWNVKTGTRKNGVAGRGVLIETLWNVKLFAIQKSLILALY